MKSTDLATIVLTIFFNSASAAEAPLGTEAARAAETEVEVEVEIAPDKDGAATSTPTNDIADFCFFPGTPPAGVKYTVITKLKVGKGTYGSVRDILPKLADSARKAGADAIISYTGSQRFGFWPWRMVRPVVRGVAVKWSDPQSPDCTAIGGTTLSTILATDKPPPH